jgi:hypothetical protein
MGITSAMNDVLSEGVHVADPPRVGKRWDSEVFFG